MHPSHKRKYNHDYNHESISPIVTSMWYFHKQLSLFIFSRSRAVIINHKQRKFLCYLLSLTGHSKPKGLKTKTTCICLHVRHKLLFWLPWPCTCTTFPKLSKCCHGNSHSCSKVKQELVLYMKHCWYWNYKANESKSSSSSAPIDDSINTVRYHALSASFGFSIYDIATKSKQWFFFHFDFLQFCQESGEWGIAAV